MNESVAQPLFDRSSIIDVITRYAVCIDLREWEKFGSCFADEVELHLVSTGRWVKRTRAEIIDYVRHTFAQYDATQHISANHQVTIKGDRATCLSTLNATHYVKDDPGGPLQRQIGYYHYELVKNTEWQIYRMAQDLAWQDGNQEIFDRAH